MSSLNRVELLGNLGRDPEIRSFGNGGRVANLSIATSARWKDKDSGEQREKTEWHHVAVFADGLVGVIERFCKKGSKVYISGRLETRKWQDQSGADRYTTEVVLRPFGGELILLDRREDAGGGASGGQSGGYGAGGYSAPQSPGRRELDDEIPF